jgi:transmembrane sensor
MDHNYIQALLDRYLKGETTAGENRIIEKWLEENGNADPDWGQLDRPAKDQWLSAVLKDIRVSIKINEPKVIPIKTRKYLWYKIAGAAAIFLMVSGLYLLRPLVKDPVQSQNLTFTSTGDHQKKQITLQDGTKIWLNAGSKLKYPKVFKGSSRTVYLSGEAYFDVRHDVSRPFLIHTGKVLTTVLGTAFNIKEDQERHTLQVTVTRGKVSVADDGKLLSILTHNQQVSLNLLSRKSTTQTVNAGMVVAWQESQIEFDDITFSAAAVQLEQHFHVKIVFDNEKLKNCRFSGNTLKGDHLDKILNVITGFNNAKWRRKSDGNIVIYGQGCNNDN